MSEQHQETPPDMTLPSSIATKHIRPTKRSNPPVKATPTTNNPPPLFDSGSETPTGILKNTLKYTSNNQLSHQNTESTEPLLSPSNEDSTATTTTSTTIVHERVIERSRRRRNPPKTINSSPRHDRIEGHPSIVSFNSIADVLNKAGTLPDQQRPIQPHDVIEAELSFACLAPEDYEQRQRNNDMQAPSLTEHDQESECFLNTHGDDDNEINSDDDNDNNPLWSDKENDQDEDEGLWDLLSEPLQETVISRTPRAFYTLSQAISQWVTPSAVDYVARGGHATSTLAVDTTDVGVSRCAGLMAVLQMHIPSCLKELECRVERRVVERRLSHLLRCFQYALPTPKLDLALARALCCVLLCQVLTPGEERSTELTESCRRVHMVRDEYDYLTKSALLSFRSRDSIE